MLTPASSSPTTTTMDNAPPSATDSRVLTSDTELERHIEELLALTSRLIYTIMDLCVRIALLMIRIAMLILLLGRLIALANLEENGGMFSNKCLTLRAYFYN